MAHMIPPIPKEYEEFSDEGTVFQALKKLPDDYYVFHSVSINEVRNRVYVEREIDFVVVNKNKGILCIEAKNGYNITYRDREWYYSSGKMMKHGGPYKQVSTAKHALYNVLRYHDNETVRKMAGRCKMLHAVWFFKVDEARFASITANGRAEDAPKELTLFADEIRDPTKRIEQIFNIEIPAGEDKTVRTDLTDEEFKLLLNSVLCPEFNLIPSPNARGMIIEEQMKQLLYEQYRLLDFLEDQPSAVINGAAGTGKTMIAVEKARRNSEENEKVLFLCYNRMLADYLNDTYKKNHERSVRLQYRNIEFMTISQLAQNITGNFRDFNGLQEWLIDCIGDKDKFPYQHVIIDEGQDFGMIDASSTREQAETNCSVIDTLQEVALSVGGTFYLFYDKYQMIQGGNKVEYKLPDCVVNCDCRMTLHCNCRNTKEIAQTSVTPLKDNRKRAIKVQTASAWDEPITPVMHLTEGKKKSLAALYEVLDKYIDQGIEDIVILTAGTLDYTMIADDLQSVGVNNEQFKYLSYKGKNIMVTTCIKFKGLEADAIVLIDLNRDSFSGFEGMLFYVGTSRAKKYLDFIAQISPNDYAAVVHELDENAPQRKDHEKMKKILGNVFSAEIV